MTARERKIAALRALADRPGTPEEGAAARAALERLEAKPDVDVDSFFAAVVRDAEQSLKIAVDAALKAKVDAQIKDQERERNLQWQREVAKVEMDYILDVWERRHRLWEESMKQRRPAEEIQKP